MKILLLLACVLARVAGRSSDQVILLAQGQTGSVYTESMLKSTTIPLVLTGGGSLRDLHIWSRGQPRSLRTAGPGFVVGADASNPLGPRWRYQTLSNFSLTLSNTPRAWHGRATVTPFQCAPSSPYFCDLGMAQFALAGTSVTYRVVVDLTRLRGALPPLLFYVLSRGADVLPGGALRTALPASCVNAGGLSLCSSDVGPHFSMSNDTSTVVVGSTLWRSRFAQFEVDAWTGVVRAASANPIPDGYQTAGLIIGFLVLLFPYGFAFATNPEAASYMTEFTNPQREGHINKRLAIASWAVLPLALAGGVIAWITDLGYGPPDAALLGPELETFLILLSVFVAAQLVPLVVLILLDEFHIGRGHEWSYTTPRPRLWLRSITLATTAAGTAALFFYPAVLDGDAGGDRMILLLLLFPLGITVVHGFYHLPGLMIFSTNAWAYAAGAYEILVVLGWTASIYWFFLAPTISVSSAYFGTAIDLLSAVLIVALVAALSIVLVPSEVAIAVQQLVWEREAKEKRK